MIDVEQLAKDGKLFDGRYKLLKTLSTDGGTADVWLAIDINTIDNPDLANSKDNPDSLIDIANKYITETMKKMLKEFKQFAIKGNMIDLAVGMIIGTSFNKIVSSFYFLL